MKRICLVVLFALGVLGVAMAEEQKFRLTFTESDVGLSPRDGGYTAIELNDGMRLPDRPGVPDIPVKIVKVRLPDDCDACLVEAKATTVPFAKDLLAMPQQTPVPSGKTAEFTGPDAAAYASAELPEFATLLSISKPRGYRVANIAVRPLRYNAAARTLDLATEIELTVTPKSAQFAKGKAEEEVTRLSDRRRTFESAINREVLNPFVSAAAPQFTAVPATTAVTQTYEYLIIAPAQFSDALQPLATFRQTFNGVRAKILTLEEIESGYSGTCPNGSSDTPMKMRNAIKDYVNNHGTEYVFLVGDITLLPTRRVLITADEEVRGYHYYDCPADVYFRCLHGDWDTNKNGTWGDKGDEFDFSLDVYVGRLPVVSSAQVTAYVNKVIGYENDKGGGASFVKKTFMAGCECWRTVSRTQERFTDWSGNLIWQDSNSGFFPRTKMNDGLPEFTDFSDTDPASDEMIWARYLFRDVINVGYGKGQKLYFLFDFLTSWDTGAKGSCECTGSNLETKLNDGYHNVFMGCHGHFPVWCLEFYENNSYTPGFFITNQASRITGRINHIYTTACLSAGWDNVVQVGEETGKVFNFEPCLAEAWLRNPNTCVTYIGNAREGWGYPYDTNGGYDQMYARAYYEQVNLVGARTIGEAYAESIAKFGSIAKYATIFRWTNCSNQMLGDPMTTIITPQSFAAPDVGIPTARVTGGALSMSVPVTDLGVSGSRAAVVFEISVDDEHFTNPILVAGGSRISEPGTVSVNYNKLPPTAKIVFVRARVLPTSGNSALSETTSVLLSAETPSVAEALDTPGRTWDTPMSGSYKWSPYAESASSGGYCVHAGKGKIGNRNLYLKTSVTGPAKMSFYTQKPTEGGIWNFYGYFDTYTNRNIFVETGPIEQMDEGATYGDAAWVKRVTFVPDGSHTAVFWYKMLAATYASSKSDFFIDRVLIRANEDGVDLTLDPTGTPTETGADLLLTVEDFSTMKQNATVKLEYSRFPDFSVSVTNTTATTISGAGQKTLTLNNLNPGCEYYVRALLTGPTKTLPLGMAHIQTAPRSGVTEPTVHAVTITKLTGTCATIDFDISVGSSGSATIFAMIGGNSTWYQELNESKVYTVDYDDLEPGKTYTLTVMLDQTQYTQFNTKFTTPDEAPPVGSVTVANVASTTATAKLTLSSFGAGRTPVVGTLHYSTDSGFVNEKTATASFTAAGTKSISLSGLSINTTYYYYVVYAGIEDVYTPSASFKTTAYTAPTCDQPPAVESVTKDGATVTVSNIAWGTGSTGGTVKIELLQGSTVVATKTGDKAGSYSFTGLTASTQYKVRVTLTGSNGLTLVDESQTFTTEDEPQEPFVTLSAATATVSEDGTSATLSVTVEDTNVSGGALVLTLNGVEQKSWTLAKGAFSQDVSVTPGSVYTFSFVATGTDVTETASGSFAATVYVGWFDVRFGDSGFVEGADWIASSTDKSGGTFTAEEGTETELVKGDVNSISTIGEVVYTPSHASETEADVKVEGRVQVSIRKTEPTVTDVKAAFYFASSRKARVYGAGGWTDLPGTFTVGAWLDYVFELDYSSESAPRVRYTIGSATSDWIATSAATRNVQRVRFNGGVVSDFAAGYYSLTGEEPIVLEKPEFTSDGTALAFGGAAGSETFSMTIANPVKGAYYTVFTSTSLNGTFTAEKASVLCDSSAATYTLTVDANTPAKFAKIVISTAPFAAGAPLPEK